jgi:hypothetical protein
MIEHNKSRFKGREHLNKEFPLTLPNLAQAVRIVTKRSNVDNSIIDVSLLVSQVLFGSFHITLPPTFTMKTPEATAATRGKKDSSHIEEDNDGKCKKKKTEETQDLIKNDTPHPELCMFPNKMWPINFSKQEHRQQTQIE